MVHSPKLRDTTVLSGALAMKQKVQRLSRAVRTLRAENRVIAQTVDTLRADMTRAREQENTRSAVARAVQLNLQLQVEQYGARVMELVNALRRSEHERGLLQLALSQNYDALGIPLPPIQLTRATFPQYT